MPAHLGTPAPARRREASRIPNFMHGLRVRGPTGSAGSGSRMARNATTGQSLEEESPQATSHRLRGSDAQGPRRGRDSGVARRGRCALDARAAGGVGRTRAIGVGRCADEPGNAAVGGKRPPMATKGAGTACADLHADVPATGGATKRTGQKARLWHEMVAHMCRTRRRCACGEGESPPPRRKGTKDGNDHRTRTRNHHGGQAHAGHAPAARATPASRSPEPSRRPSASCHGRPTPPWTSPARSPTCSTCSRTA